MIPNSLVGFVVFAASLGPGYVFVRISERREPRPDRSALMEAAEMILVGATTAAAAALTVLGLTRWQSRAAASDIVQDPSDYIATHPFASLGLLFAFLLLSYALAVIGARLTHRGRAATFQPGGTAWIEVFLRDGALASNVVLVTLELRDGRKVAGKLRSFTSEANENREIALCAPLAAQAAPGKPMARIKDHFFVVREADVSYIAGRYVAAAGTEPGTEASKTGSN